METLAYIARLFVILSLSALVLALSGIYAVMSFAVWRRTREIGIRIALGASRSGVVLTILRRPLVQMSLGIALGGALTFLWVESFGLSVAYLLATAAYLTVAFLLCLPACLAPARRAVRVDPIEALRVD